MSRNGSRADTIFERLLGVPEDRVLDLLRSIHQTRPRPNAAASKPGWLALLEAIRSPESPPTEPLPRLPLQPDWSDFGAAETGRGSTDEPAIYERAQAHFSEVEQRLRGEAKLSDALIDGLRAREPALADASTPRQQSLRLIALEGGVAGGRFVVANDRREPVELSFRHTSLRPTRTGAGAPVELDAVVRCEPAALSLTPGASELVRVWIDLSDLPDLENRLEMCIDVTDGAHCLQKLFIEIEIHTSLPRAAPREAFDG